MDFIVDIQDLRRAESIPPELIINLDETALYFDRLPLYTYELRCVKHPSLKVSNMSKKRITENYLIFKNKTAWMTREIFTDFLKYSVKRFLEMRRVQLDKANQKGLILLDNFAGHVYEDDELKALEQEIDVKIKYLPPNCTAYLQPLDLSINYTVKSKLKNQWIN